MEIFKTVFFFVFVLCQLCYAADVLSVDCQPPSIAEGTEGMIIVQKLIPDSPLRCSVTVLPPNKVTANVQQLTLNNNGQIAFKINVIPDGKPGDYEAVLIISCDGQPVFTKKIPVISTDSIVEGDPHFSQLIVDRQTEQIERICYDVSGKSGDYIEIYTHQPTKTYVYGQLLDDYYMHIIKIFSTLGNVTVSTKHVKFNNEVLYAWEESNDIRLYHRGGYMIKIDDNSVTVEVVNKEDMTFRVTRSKHPVTGHYLDFGVFGMLKYDNVDGLLGRIGNNLFKFYDFVQTEDNTKRGTILINGHFAVASKKSKSNSCWLVDVKDVLHPYSITDYILRN
ncbi:DgyrCDS4499 [Dimorphilus gyrociliatus]|uniref:DgyrCDS4499 n=1 Tax=Dimorphilus gyrociliatus TaxID=2664684 RepID=A0A7I8VIL8_9ANNE|nr:DgyrCDS4499 [Dimorphilus gyrociliatus]